MRVIKVEETEIASWTRTLLAEQRVVAVQERDERFVFDELHQAEDLRLDHDVTLQPPLRYLLPEKEELVAFDMAGRYQPAEPDERPFVLLGLHPYDVAAIRQMDAVFAQGVPDPHYSRRRELATLVACDVETPSGNVFAGTMGTAVVREGYDVLLTRIGREYLVESRTGKGDGLLALFGGDVHEATLADLRRREAVWQRNRQGLRQHELDCPPDALPRLLALGYNDDLWQERSELCLSCGSCNLVCPTCYCFDVEDVVNLDMKSGKRLRLCDSCMLQDFAKVAGGHQFRLRRDRYRHRFYRKGLYMPERFGFVACVGCGRCIDSCVAGVANPVDVYNALLQRHPEAVEEPIEGESVASLGKALEALLGRSAGQEPTPVTAHPQAVAVRPRREEPDPWLAVPRQEPATLEREIELLVAKDPYVPECATIVEKRPVTQHETFYRLRLDSGRSLGHRSGQFVQISLMGIGEAPISVSSGPSDEPAFEMVVRRVGNVTEALERLEPGVKVGVRGPYGTSFPMADLRGRDILVVAGGIGIVPVRSAIQEVLGHRSDYGRLTIAYGMRAPQDRLFGAEIAAWLDEPQVTVLETVDHLEDLWHGQVGPVTTLLPSCGIDVGRTAALVCGPPVMYRYVLSDLIAMGMRENDIYVSLERKMKCGIGKCGHCQINGTYVCQDGPVFTYAQVRNLPEALQ